jgi:hypothetical protein
MRGGGIRHPNSVRAAVSPALPRRNAVQTIHTPFTWIDRASVAHKPALVDALIVESAIWSNDQNLWMSLGEVA